MWASHGLDRFCVRPYLKLGPVNFRLGIGGPRGFDKWLPRIPPTKAAKPSFRHACGRADRILRPPGQGGVKFIVRISENYTLCHANLNTTIKGLCFIIFHSSLIL
jgi:hypothetical protein